jgi:hypothetical protein
MVGKIYRLLKFTLIVVQKSLNSGNKMVPKKMKSQR